MEGKTAFVIRTAQEAAELRLRTKGRRSDFQKIQLDTGKMVPADERITEHLLNKYFFACGCIEGSVVGIIMLAGYIYYAADALGGLMQLSWIQGLYAFIAFFLGTGLGKAIGLLYARMKLDSMVRNLVIKLLDAPDRTENPVDARCANS